MKHPKTLITPSLPHALSGNPVALPQIVPGLHALMPLSKTARGLEADKSAMWRMRRITSLISAKYTDNILETAEDRSSNIHKNMEIIYMRNRDCSADFSGQI